MIIHYMRQESILRSYDYLQGSRSSVPWMKFLSICIVLVYLVFNTAYGLPVVPDREIPPQLQKVNPSKITVKASSVARGFSERNVLKNLGWRAWGSALTDTGPWFEFTLDQSEYISLLHFVPGDERAPKKYDTCGRPARVILRDERGGTRDVNLDDRRYHQYINLDPPLYARTVRLIFKEQYGESIETGICFAALSIFYHHTPMNSLPALVAEAEALISQLEDPLKQEEIFARLPELGGVILPPLQKALTQQSTQRNPILLSALLNALSITAEPHWSSQIFPILRSLPPSEEITLALASLGDTQAAAQLLDGIEDQPSKIKLKRLHALSNDPELRHLPALLNIYGRDLTLDEALRPLFLSIPNIYSKIRTQYLQSNGQRQAALLALLASLDAQATSPLVEQAVADQTNTALRAGAILSAIYYDDDVLKSKVRSRAKSPFSFERVAVAKTVSHWKSVEDLTLLSDLAEDSSMSVRVHALKGLSGLGKEADTLLKRVALQGSDSSSAKAAAESFLISVKGKLHLNRSISLLNSKYETVREYALFTVSQHRERACLPLIELALSEEVGRDEAARGLHNQWDQCEVTFNTSLDTLKPEQATHVLPLIKAWRIKAAFPYVESSLESPFPEVRAAAISAWTGITEVDQTALLNAFALKDERGVVACMALQKLVAQSPKKARTTLQQLFEQLDQNQPKDRMERIQCYLRAAQITQPSNLFPKLLKIYRSLIDQSKSRDMRQQIIDVALRSQSTARLELLIDAISDPDPQIKRAAERGLNE